MMTAKEISAQTMFIDLPHYAREAKTPVPLQRRNLDEIAPTSAFYQLLAKHSGSRSWNETWDRLFETPREGQPCETLRREVALFCAAIRATTSPQSLASDGTLARERFMLKTIRETLVSQNIKPQEAMVVCGGFHIFLDQGDTTPPPPIPRGR